ncbi:hypothetical protein WJX73_004499 [Symbiochloris irregularis]|uniref:Protein kinase domain-containing protein n=1 Tax=Symbiochloris irregularis TaxID=706552 RepID=A0AAW1PN01_9CHLO
MRRSRCLVLFVTLAEFTGFFAKQSTQASLLDFKALVNATGLEAACGSWEEVGPGPCLPDQWGCVTCDQDGELTGLNISWGGESYLELGEISDAWGYTLGSIPSLQTLNLGRVQLTATLPAALGEYFPNLTTFSITDSIVPCCLPDEWGRLESWPMLTTLTIDSVMPLLTSLPDWASPQAWRSLTSLTLVISDNASNLNASVQTQLPASWSQGFKQLQNLEIGGRRGLVSPNLPEEWGINDAFPALQNLIIFFDASIGATLPSVWGSHGGLASLQSVAISSLSGTLPNQWGTRFASLSHIAFPWGALTGSLPSSWGSLSLAYIDLSRNFLEGPIPETWKRVQRLILFPGNIGLCGSLPANLTLQECSNSAASAASASNLPACGWQAKLLQLAQFVHFDPNLALAPIGHPLIGWANYPAVLNQSSFPVDTADACNWTRVLCSSDGNIRSLDLSYAFLYGLETSDYDGEETVQWASGPQEALNKMSPSPCGNFSNLQSLNLSSTRFMPNVSTVSRNAFDVDGSSNLQLGVFGSDVVTVSLTQLVSWEFPELLHLDISSSNLVGSIPSEWRGGKQLPKLQSFVAENVPMIDRSWEALATAMPSLVFLNLNNTGAIDIIPTGKNGHVFSLLRCLVVSAYLPSHSSAFPNLTHLIMDGNTTTASLPEWQESFPSLELFSCQWCILSGTLGLLGQPNLHTIRLPGNSLSGTLPASWSMSQLRYVDLTANRLNGTLPSSWSQLPFAFLSLQNNSISGTLPASWGCNGQGWTQAVRRNNPAGIVSSTPATTWLDLSMNQLTGTIPEDFGCNGSLASLVNSSYRDDVYCPSHNTYLTLRLGAGGLSMNNNSLQGSVPSTFAEKVAIAALLPGNTGLNNDSSADGLPPLPAPTLLPFNEAHLGSNLFAIKSAFQNFNSSLSFKGGGGWVQNGSSACLPSPWPGLTCSGEGHLLAINFAGWNLQGTLAPEWSQLTHLQSVDLSQNPLISGTLPPEWGGQRQFPQLQIFLLEDAVGLSGSIPSNWGSSWPRLLVLDLSHTGVLGPLPASWSQSDAFPKLQKLSLSNSKISGSLPVFGRNASAALQQLQLGSCSFSGTLPESYGSLGQLQLLDLSTNRLNSSLPASWGTNGNLPSLTFADLSANSLQGSLPGAWFTQGALKSLATLNISSNALTSSISWQSMPPALTELTVQPLNSKMCGPVPAGVPAYGASGPITALGPCPSHLSKAAIAGIVVGAVAAFAFAAAGLTFAWRRQLAKVKAKRYHSYDPLIEFYKVKEAQQASMEVGDASLLSTAADSNVSPMRLTIVETEGEPVMLGEGAYGKVFKALLNKTQEVAIKFLNPSAVGSHDINRKRFEDEIRIMLLCDHTNVIACHGAFLSKNLIYCVCEYAALGDLHAALRNDTASDRHYSWYKRGRQVALDVARGLDYLHNRKVLHLDVKPSNVVLMHEGTAKLTDVGLSRQLEGKSYLSGTAVGGTHDYRAPETFAGLKVSFSADIWSYGVILLEIITGQQQRRGSYVKPSDIPAQCPANIAALADQCMANDAMKRPSVKDIIRRLERSHSDMAAYV